MLKNSQIKYSLYAYSVFSLFLLIVAGCGELKKDGNAPSISIELPSTAPPPATTRTKEEELAQLTLDFKTRYAASFSYIIDFKPSSYMNSGGGGGIVVGVCEVYSNGSKQIHMNQDWWPTASALNKMVLTFHELGHCYFQRGHDSRTYSDGRPYSMMNPIIDPVSLYFTAYSTYYLNELQNPMALTTQTYPITYKTYIDGICDEE